MVGGNILVGAEAVARIYIRGAWWGARRFCGAEVYSVAPPIIYRGPQLNHHRGRAASAPSL